MKRIRKEKSEYYYRRLHKLFETEPSSKTVEKRYRTLRYVLLEKHPFIEAIGKDTFCEFLKEAVFIDRIIRRETENLQIPLKRQLSDEFIITNLQ
jgi:hypothetical protein